MGSGDYPATNELAEALTAWERQYPGASPDCLPYMVLRIGEIATQHSGTTPRTAAIDDCFAYMLKSLQNDQPQDRYAARAIHLSRVQQLVICSIRANTSDCPIAGPGQAYNAYAAVTQAAYQGRHTLDDTKPFFCLWDHTSSLRLRYEAVHEAMVHEGSPIYALELAFKSLCRAAYGHRDPMHNTPSNIFFRQQLQAYVRIGVLVATRWLDDMPGDPLRISHRRLTLARRLLNDRILT